jgi:sulfate transport system permease protein
MRRAMIAITYILFAAILIIPLIRIYMGAFAQGWQACMSVFVGSEVQHALLNSLIIVAVVTLLNSIFGIVLALYLVRSQSIPSWIKIWTDKIVDLPFAVSPVIGGLMIVLLFGPNTVVGAFFGTLGFKIVYALPGMILATLFVTFPLMIREVIPVLQQVGQDQEHAAYTLGANSWRTFWTVTWPSIRWAVWYGVVLTIARSLGEFGAILVVSGNIIGETQTATTFVYQAVEDFQYVPANTISMVLVTLSIIILLISEWMKHRKEVV